MNIRKANIIKVLLILGLLLVVVNPIAADSYSEDMVNININIQNGIGEFYYPGSLQYGEKIRVHHNLGITLDHTEIYVDGLHMVDSTDEYVEFYATRELENIVGGVHITDEWKLNQIGGGQGSIVDPNTPPSTTGQLWDHFRERKVGVREYDGTIKYSIMIRVDDLNIDLSNINSITIQDITKGTAASDITIHYHTDYGGYTTEPLEDLTYTIKREEGQQGFIENIPLYDGIYGIDVIYTNKTNTVEDENNVYAILVEDQVLSVGGWIDGEIVVDIKPGDPNYPEETPTEPEETPTEPEETPTEPEETPTEPEEEEVVVEEDEEEEYNEDEEDDKKIEEDKEEDNDKEEEREEDDKEIEDEDKKEDEIEDKEDDQHKEEEKEEDDSKKKDEVEDEDRQENKDKETPISREDEVLQNEIVNEIVKTGDSIRSYVWVRLLLIMMPLGAVILSRQYKNK